MIGVKSCLWLEKEMTDDQQIFDTKMGNVWLEELIKGFQDVGYPPVGLCLELTANWEDCGKLSLNI